MRVLLSKLTYANVVATLALFMAMGGGVVWAAEQLGKNTVRSKNIAPKAVKTADIAKNAVKSSKLAANAVKNPDIAPAAVTRSKLQTGTLAGLQVADAIGTNIPGLATEATGAGTPVPLTGTAAFTPATGKSYELLAELRANPTDANGAEPGGCFAGVQIYVNGEPTAFLGVNANAEGEAPFALNQVGNASTAIGMLTAGQAQTISAGVFGDPDCGAATTGNLRISVVEFG